MTFQLPLSTEAEFQNPGPEHNDNNTAPEVQPLRNNAKTTGPAVQGTPQNNSNKMAQPTEPLCNSASTPSVAVQVALINAIDLYEQPQATSAAVLAHQDPTTLDNGSLLNTATLAELTNKDELISLQHSSPDFYSSRYVPNVAKRSI